MNIQLGSLTGEQITTRLIIVFLIALCLFFKFCGHTSPTPQVAKGKDSVSYVHDTTTVTLTKYIVQTATQKDSIPVIRDSLIYIKQLFTQHTYKRLFSDSNINITELDTVNKDSLYKGSIKYKWLKAQTIINNVTVPNKIRNIGFIGIGLGIDNNALNISPHFSWLTKSYTLFTFSSDLLHEPSGEISISAKIHFSNPF